MVKDFFSYKLPRESDGIAVIDWALILSPVDSHVEKKEKEQ